MDGCADTFVAVWSPEHHVGFELVLQLKNHFSTKQIEDVRCVNCHC